MRKLLCLFAALVTCLLLASVASAAETATVPTTCEACGTDVTWEPLPSGNTWRTLDAGHYHYYLTKKETTYRYTPDPNSAASSTNSGNAVTICLDLNGFAYETDGRTIGLYSGCTLNIMDSSTDNTGYVKGTSGNNNTVGGTFFAYGTLNVYDVTLKFANDGAGTNPTYAGGVVSLGSSYPNATLNMYGGRLEGGEMVSHSNTRGGTIFAGKGSINLYNTEVISGSVPEGKNGPCVYLDGAVNLKLSGNTDVEHIYVNSASAKLNIDGTYSGKTRVFYSSTISLSEGKVIGTATNTPKITGDLFCTSGNGWIPAVSGSNLILTAYTPSGTRHYCQHCQEVVVWTDYNTSNYKTPNSTAGTYHYYLSQKRTANSSSYPQLKSGSVVCLDMYGNSLTASGRALLANGGSTLNVMDTVGGGFIAGGAGTNNPRGGTVTVSGSAILNMYSGTLKYITGSGDAANGMVAIGGTLNLYGGRIEGADFTNQSTSTGGAITLYNSTSVFNAYGGEVTSGKVGSKAPCVYVSATGPVVKLAGDAIVEDIYFISNNQKLTVSGTYTGTANVTYGTSPALGDQVGTATDDARVLGEIACTNGDWLIRPENGKLVIAIDASVVVVDGENETGYETLQAAINACTTGYVKLLDPITENVTVSKDTILDLNGQSITGTVTVAEGATLYGKDVQTDDYTVADNIYGTLTVTGSFAGADGYLPITKNGKTSFHRITVKITDMSLRPEKAGIYYKSSFLGDELVADVVKTYGVALSVKETPTAQNMTTACLSSAFTEFESGAAGNAGSSTLLKNILKTENPQAINHRNLQITIYGRPYIQTDDGYIFGEAKSRTLGQQMKSVNEIFDSITASQRYAVMNMYETYQPVLEKLNLSNVTQHENTLSILMVGNSFCYYYVEELYGLLMANPDPNRGYDKVEIYNLYESGCKLTTHHEWWVNGYAGYDLYKTDASGRVKQVPTVGADWSLEESLLQERWDYISLQGMSNEVSYANGTAESNVAGMTPYMAPLLARFHELHPYAQLLWHRTWPFEEGRKSGSTTYTAELNAAYNAGMQATCNYVCDVFDLDKPYDLKIVNAGAAWPIAREANAMLETSLIPEGGLCARKGIRNESTFPYFTGNSNAGDGYHDGDIGGGQFLNACVWYETLTGQSVLDNPYKPTTTKGEYEVGGTYTLSDDFADLLRNAAHAATIHQ